MNENCAPLISSRDTRTDKVVDHLSQNGDCGTDRFENDFSGIMEYVKTVMARMNVT